VRAGQLLAAEFVNQGRTLRAIHYQSSYYTPEGKSLRKAFLRYPLEFSRVSSGFGMRHHPIRGGWRAHKGIDYAAPTGTRVRAVADAVVEYAGIKGGYGNVVILRHNGQYSTVYGHLSRIMVRRGARVAQNDTIGLVGQTGWATGPHLHYEFRIAGQARNPLTIAMPAAAPVPREQLPAFEAIAQPLVARLDLVANANLALLD
jgi:murein DD-endopeptidase MepM/ murein hydrolase activator NlpD